jgi:hypothetical protein
LFEVELMDANQFAFRASFGFGALLYFANSGVMWTMGSSSGLAPLRLESEVLLLMHLR